MLQIYFLFAIILFSGHLCSAENEFGYEHRPYHHVGGWLRLHKLAANWDDARLRCHLEGGILASPSSLITMKKMMAEEDPPVSAVFVEKPPSYMDLQWVGGELPCDDDCQTMNDAGELSVANCTDSNRYFCYKEYADKAVNHCGLWDKDYQLDPRTASCYKFHTTPRSWFGAVMACRAEHAHLAVINSATEAEVLEELFEQHPKDTLAHTQDADYVHIGFWDWKENGEWQTIFGHTLSEAGFGTWDANEPNHAGSNPFCGTLHRNGVLNDHSCDAKEAFICEITTV